MKSSSIALAVMMAVASSAAHAASHPSERPIHIKNESGRRAEVHWVSDSGEYVLLKGSMMDGQTLSLNSFVNHTFLVRELPDSPGGTCNPGTSIAAPSLAPCKTAFIRVNENEDQVHHVLKGMEVEVEDGDSKPPEEESTSKESSIASKCKERVKRHIQYKTMSPDEIVAAFAKCAQPLVAHQMEQSNDRIKEEAKFRMGLAEQWEDYTCADFDMPTSTPIRIESWSYHDKEHEVGVLLDRDSAKIHYVRNFITPEECAAIEAAARPKLHKATVANGSGGSHLQESRKALQAGVAVPWEEEDEGDLIATVSRRLYTYINDATGYGIEEAGQEDLMSIQYFGRGLDDPAPDRYRPHCDGQCDGLKFQDAGRVATMVMYCAAPEKGGATNFRNAGIHVVPEVGTAAFFSYLGSDGKTDDHLTEHSCCPVLEGEKKIAVQWLRLGVDEENPWNAFNTLNVRIGSEEYDS